MNLSKVSDSLKQIYQNENHRIVFWYDPECEFTETLGELNLVDVKIVRLDQIAGLELKILLEIEDKKTPFLIYAPFQEPDIQDNWLLDVLLYSRSFYADTASIILDELKLNQQSLRSHIKKRASFFKNKDRMGRLMKWVLPQDNEDDLEMKMLAVLVRADQPELFSVMIKLFGEHSGLDDLKESVSGAWEDIEKHGLSDFFWERMGKTFGYKSADNNLYDLLIRLFVTDFSKELHGETPSSLRHFVLQDGPLPLNATVFLSQWRNSLGNIENYNQLSMRLSKELNLSSLLPALDEKALEKVMTFEDVEKHIIRCLRDHIVNNRSNGNEIKKVVEIRSDGHWAGKNSIIKNDDNKNLYSCIYNAIESSIRLFELRDKYAAGLSFSLVEDMYKAYEKELFYFDQNYRLFYENSDHIENEGWDILKELREKVEDCYSQWFIPQLALTWDCFLYSSKEARGNALLENWALKDVSKQSDFYNDFVNRFLEESAQGKVYVIISDAFRYEAAEELTKSLNRKNRVKAELSSMLGVLPSYTALGMASLLPHKEIEFKSNANLDVFVDNINISSYENRSKVLAKVQGVAIKAEDLTAKNKPEGREFIKPYRVIYVYHDLIDSTGEKKESKTFDSVRRTINEINSLVLNIINNLNGSQIYITADHGFLFQQTAPLQQDKSKLESLPQGTLKAKKRYLLGKNIGVHPKVWNGGTSVTVPTKNECEFWIPKGANRFHFSGGARFVHGGAMLQEVMIPMVSVKGVRGKAVSESQVRKVEVSLLSNIRKLVNNVQFFEFIQTEPVLERVLPRTLAISLRDGEKLISNEIILTFNSDSRLMDDRKKSAKIVIKSGNYKKNRDYFLILSDKDSTIEYQRIPITIDLAFTNDF